MVAKIELTESHLSQALSSRGALSIAQFKSLGYKGSFKGWKRLLVGRMHTERQIGKFISLQDAHRVKRGQKVRKPRKKRSLRRTPRVPKKYSTPEWKKKRDEILNRDKLTCVRCGKHKYDGVTLNVHHMLYVKGIELWEVPDYYLVTLCTDCHKHEHSKQFTPPPRVFDDEGNCLKK